MALFLLIHGFLLHAESVTDIIKYSFYQPHLFLLNCAYNIWQVGMIKMPVSVAEIVLHFFLTFRFFI